MNFGWTHEAGTGSFAQFGDFFVPRFEPDPLEKVLVQRLLERINSDLRIKAWVAANYPPDAYGQVDGTAFIQRLIRAEKEWRADLKKRFAELEKAGRFKPREGQVEVVFQELPRTEIPLVIEEVPEKEFLPTFSARNTPNPPC